MYIMVLRNREPISYGDESIGIKTLIKRISILLPENGEIIQVPVILGNGFRGILRDVMTYVFLEKVAEIAKSNNGNVNVDARVLLLMLSGGVLKRRSNAQVTASIVDNIRSHVELLPPLSIMGFSLSNVMLPSKIKVSVFYPVAKETIPLVGDLVEKVKRNSDSIDFDEFVKISVKNIVDDVQMSHKDDISKLGNMAINGIEISELGSADSMRGRMQRENEESLDDRGRLQAIFQREYIIPGTMFVGYLSEIVPLTDVEKELLILAIKRIGENIGVGGGIVRGFGSFTIEYNELDFNINNEVSKLTDFIKNNLQSILSTLNTNPEEWISSSTNS